MNSFYLSSCVTSEMLCFVALSPALKDAPRATSSFLTSSPCPLATWKIAPWTPPSTSTYSRVRVSYFLWAKRLTTRPPPYGGGRVVSLFAHKKYDTLTLEYVDVDGGVHGAIFQVAKGQGELVRNELVARGASFSAGESATKQSISEVTHEDR